MAKMLNRASVVAGVVTAALSLGGAFTAYAAPAHPTTASQRTGHPAVPGPGGSATRSGPEQLAAAPTVASVAKQLTDLANRNEILTEQFNQAAGDVDTRQRQARAAQQAADRAVAAYRGARNEMKLSLQAQYQEGSFVGATAVLTSKSGENYVDETAALAQIASRRAGLAAMMAADRASAQQASARAADLVSAATAKRDALARQRLSLAAQQKTYKHLLAVLTVKQQQAYFRAASVRAERNRVLAAEKAAASGATSPGTRPTPPTAKPTSAPTSSTPTARNTAHHRTGSSHGSGSTPRPAPPVPNTSSAAAIAVRYALAQVGKPYVYATSGPNTFDCSGLTLASWRAAGRTLPHQSAMQARLGHPVSRSELQPGDLVFYYSPIHHVAIYIGKGLVVSAPQTGDVVKIVPVDGAGPYNMAVRL